MKIKIVLATINNVIGYRLLVVLAPGNQEDISFYLNTRGISYESINTIALKYGIIAIAPNFILFPSETIALKFYNSNEIQSLLVMAKLTE